METPAWRALSPTAQALYPWLKLEWKGTAYNNNGKIRLSVRQAADRLGISEKPVSKAFHELQAKGFIVVTELAALGQSKRIKSTSYLLTELQTEGNDGERIGQKFRDWRKGHDFEVVMPVKRSGNRTKKQKPMGKCPTQSGRKAHVLEKTVGDCPTQGGRMSHVSA
jgi:DNA-binding Lrp family transcriptional regulator